jgi:hypothetical protein
MPAHVLRCGVHGCKHETDAQAEPEDSRCYFCCNNPFFEVLFYNPDSPTCPDNGEDATLDSEWNTVPVTGARACFRALAVGTKLLVQAKTLSSMFETFQMNHQSHLAKKVKARYIQEHRQATAAAAGAKDPSHAQEGSSLPTSHMKQRARSMHVLMQSSATQQQQQQNGSSDRSRQEPRGMLSCMLDNTARGQAELQRAMEQSLVQCYLNVTSILSCKDGLVCIAVLCARKDAKNAGKEVKNIYVAPQDLMLPESDKQWDESLSYIFV